MTSRLRPRFLVTAGNTREAIDSVRDWGNRFTGNTGLAIARELARFGNVELLTSNERHIEILREEGDPNLTGTPFRSHAELRALLEGKLAPGLRHPEGIFMTAAVADYRPSCSYQVTERRTIAPGVESWIVRDVQADKVKSTFDEIAVLGARTEKLVDLFRTEWGFAGLLVKFKLEVSQTHHRLLDIARASRRASDADYVVANTLDMVTPADAALSGFGAGAYLVGASSEEWIARDRLASRLAEIAQAWLLHRPVTAASAAPAFVCG